MNRRARGGGNSNCRWAGILIVADHSFPADQSDLAPLKSQYTHRVQQTAVRLVIEDDMPYRMASWHWWRDHRVFVPWATIQNWVEAAGEKKPGRR